MPSPSSNREVAIDRFKSYRAAVQPQTNYFAYPTAAERYASGRPYFHPLAIERIRALCCPTGRVARALDVGCGTGRSSIALLDIADEIVGVDSSAEMLIRAQQNPRVSYVCGQAESLPFEDASFEFITVALAFHWFDRERFLAEAGRILRIGGWLVIYNDVFAGHMAGNEYYAAWNREHYLSRFPSPIRNSDAVRHGFSESSFEEFVHEIAFTRDQLVNYFLTQTNVIAAVEAGGDSLDSVANWLLESVRPFFANEAERFQFSCQIRCFRGGAKG